MAEFWIESIGLFAGFIGIVAWIPQIRRVWVDEKEEGISLPTFLAVTVSLSLWLVYGIIVNSIAMIVSNILTLAFIIAITLGVYRIRSKRTEDDLNKPTSSSE
ncbi:MAG: SemiSWEET family transporter [Candidatus Thermoplasmatota archaeon]|nr:SemiSWEET family transporter [Candidatus Thermoplasmatota archaeon]